MPSSNGHSDERRKQEQAAKLAEQGNSLLDEKKYKEAIPIFTSALDNDPMNLLALSGLGSAYANLDREDIAAGYFDRVLEIDSHYLSEDMIKSYAFTNKHDKIIELSNAYPEVSQIRAIVLNPNASSSSEIPDSKEIILLALVKSFSVGVLEKNFNEIIQIGDGLSTLSGDNSIARSFLPLRHNVGKYEEVISFFTASHPENDEETNLLVDSLESKGQYEEIHEIYKKEKETLLPKHDVKPSDSDLLRQGNVLLNLGELDEAIKCFDKVSESGKDYHDAVTFKGTALSKQGKSDEAIKCFDKVLDEKPLRFSTLYSRGTCLDRWGKYDEAVRDYDTILRYLPFRVDVLVDKGISLFNLGKYEEAKKSYDEALAYNKRSNKALVGRGQCLTATGCPVKSLDPYAKVLEVNKNYADAWLNMAEAYRVLKKTSEANEYYEKSLKCYDTFMKYRGKSVEALNNKGVALFQLQKYQSAIETYNEALKLNNSFAKTWINKGLAHYFLNRYEDAIESYRQCIETDSDVRLALILKGLAQYRMGKYDEAIDAYDRVINMSENKNSLAYILRGEANLGRGKYALALQDFHMVSEEKHDYQKCFGTGLCHYQLGFFDDAEKYYRDAINARPEAVGAYYNLGVLYNNEGKRERAIKAFETAESIDRNFSKAREARMRLQEVEQSDWYDWWFKKGIGKKVIGGLLLFIIGTLVVTTSYLSLSSTYNVDFLGIYPNGTPSQPSNSNQTDTSEASNMLADNAGIIVIIILLTVVLLLPSLKKVKLGNVEIETQEIEHERIPFEPLISHIQDESVTQVSISFTK